MDDTTLLDPFRRLLEQISTTGELRAVSSPLHSPSPEGEGLKRRLIEDLWSQVTQSGYLDALVPEAAGGVGLALRDIAPLVEALGHHLTPAPVAQTMVARALLSANGAPVPSGPIVLATLAAGVARRVPLAMVAEFALVDTGSKLDLIRLDENAQKSPDGSLSADICWAGPLVSLERPSHGLRPLSAVLLCAQMAGAAARVLDMTVDYANERSQFGKPIGKQQAIQQQLSLMAEKTVLLRMAARLGCACDLVPGITAAATAKSVASAAIVDIAAIAHAVHGAIGISAEHDLQLYTRNMHEWRVAEGSESHWSAILGTYRLASDARQSTDFIRTI